MSCADCGPTGGRRLLGYAVRAGRGLAKVRKAIAGLAGALAVIATTHLLTGVAQDWCVAIVAAATAAGVYTVPNRKG